MMAKKKDETDAAPPEPNPVEGQGQQMVPEPEDTQREVPGPSPGATDTAPLQRPDLSGDGGVGRVATDPVSAHDAEVQAIVEQALAEQQETHDEEIRDLTNAKRGPDVPGRPATRPLALGSSGRIKVRAVELGYYDHERKRPGDVFWIKDAQAFSDAHAPRGQHQGWMERVDILTPEHTTTATQALAAEHGRLREESAPPIITGDEDVMKVAR